MTAPTGSEIGARVAQARASHGLTLQQVADRIGCSNANALFIEQGRKKDMRLDMVWRLAEALSVSPAWLLGISETQEIDPLVHRVALLIADEVRRVTNARDDRGGDIADRQSGSISIHNGKASA